MEAPTTSRAASRFLSAGAHPGRRLQGEPVHFVVVQVAQVLAETPLVGGKLAPRPTLHDSRVAPRHENTAVMKGDPHPGPLPEGEGETGSSIPGTSVHNCLTPALSQREREISSAFGAFPR